VRLFVDVDGAQLVPDGPWLRERPTFVLVHSGPGFDHAGSKAHAGPWFARRGQVVYVDLRGHGRSDRGDPRDWRLDVWADDLAALCELLGIERPVVAGHGFGAMVVANLAIRHPELPRGLLLNAPAARIVPARSVAVFDRLGGAAAGEAARAHFAGEGDESFYRFLRVLYPILNGRDAPAETMVRASWNPDVSLQWFRGEARTVDLRAGLRSLRVPVLVLAGEDDAWSPPATVREFLDALPPGLATVHSYPGVRHTILRDNPAALASIDAFVHGLWLEEQVA
jgi:proline iminopeptidase